MLTIELDEPFRLDLTVWALRRRAHNTIDRWDASTYQRTLSLDGGVMALSVKDGTLDQPGLLVAFAGMPADGSAELLARDAAHTLLGLNVDVSAFAAMAAHDPLLGPLALRMRGLRPPRFPTVFEALVNGVACQQLSIAVGIHLLNRVTAAHGRPVGNDDPARARSQIRNRSRCSTLTFSHGTASAWPKRAPSSRLPRHSSPAISTARACIGSTTRPRSST